MAIAQDRLDELWDFPDAQASESRLRRAADEETDAEARAELQTQVARALGLQGRFADADALLDTVSSEDPAASAVPVVRARVALERGRLRNSGGDAAGAVALFHEAAAAAASARLLFLRIDALHMLAIADPAGGARYTDEALALLDGISDPRTLRWRVSLHNNRGWALRDAGDAAGAVAEFERAKDAATRWGTRQQVEWAEEALAEARAALDAPGH
jgi:tetratricopeptide (TPR) repeat protein